MLLSIHSYGISTTRRSNNPSLDVSFWADAGSEASVNKEQHQPSRPSGPSAPIKNGSASASTSSVEQPALAAKPYIALLQPEGEWKHLINHIVYFVANKLEDPGQPQGLIYEQALRPVWYELEVDGSTN